MLRTLLLVISLLGWPAWLPAETGVQLTPATTVAVLPWGDGPAEVRFSPETGPGEGVPTSFLMDRQGRLHVLDAAAFRILPEVTGSGRAGAPIDLMATGLVKPNSVLVDFDLCADGTYVVLDQEMGTAFRVSRDGKPLGRFGQFRFGRELAAAPDGRVLVRDPGVPAVNVFTPKGQFAGERRDSHWTVYVDSKGRQYREQLATPRRAVLMRAPLDGGAPSIVATAVPLEPGHELAEAKVIGLDAQDRVYLQTTEVENGHWLFVRILRYLPSGALAGELRVPQSQDELTSPPRFWRATPAGDVLAFRTHSTDGYILSRYSFSR